MRQSRSQEGHVLEDLRGKLFQGTRYSTIIFTSTVEIQVEPVSQLDLEANPDEICSLFNEQKQSTIAST